MKVQVFRHDGDIYLVDDILRSHEHTPGNWEVVEEPTCTYEGTRIKCCTYCGEIIKVEKIPKTKHKFGAWVTTDGNIWNAPIVKTRMCSTCYTEETKKVYLWVWVKPVVMILVLLGIVAAVLIPFMKQKGMEVTLENVKVVLRESKEKIKNRQKDECPEDDIFNNQHKK